jgi:hypothetical protein
MVTKISRVLQAWFDQYHANPDGDAANDFSVWLEEGGGLKAAYEALPKKPRKSRKAKAATTTAVAVVSTDDFQQPILVEPLGPKLGMSDERKHKGRELVEMAFRPTNTVAEAVSYIRAYHRVIGDWQPSDLDIGSYTALEQKLRDAVTSATIASVGSLRENIDLQEKVSKLEQELAELKMARTQVPTPRRRSPPGATT